MNLMIGNTPVHNYFTRRAGALLQAGVEIYDHRATAVVTLNAGESNSCVAERRIKATVSCKRTTARLPRVESSDAPPSRLR